jgi:hypothetical protein
MTFNDAKQTILRRFRDSNITLAFEINSGFVFSIKPKNWSKDDAILDAFFLVNKTNGRIYEYSPLLNPDEFKHAIYNRVLYRARGEKKV